jgi:hypothetical protein
MRAARKRSSSSALDTGNDLNSTGLHDEEQAKWKDSVSSAAIAESREEMKIAETSVGAVDDKTVHDEKPMEGDPSPAEVG